MYDDMFPAERAASLSQSTQRPATAPGGPGAFTGFGSVLSDIVPNAVLTTGNAWSGILDAYGKAAAYRDAPAAAMLAGRPAPNMADLQKQTIDQMGNNQLGPDLRAEAKKYAPDPLTVGTAGQIVFGVGTSLAKAGAYSLAGPAAPVLFGADVGVNRADELKDQGVDSTTANLAGVVSGVAGAVGMKLPAALGATRLQSAAIGAVVNPALNVAEVGGIRMLLQHADYDKIADQYKPLDPVNLAVSSIVGAGFGAGFHGAKAHTPAEVPEARPDVPALTPDEHAAALVMNDVRTRDADTLTAPGDLSAANAARDAQALARQQLDAGESVSVGQQVAVEQTQLDAAYQRVLDGPVGDALDPLVYIAPDDIEGSIIARGGWKGRGDVEVQGSGWGLVKFIWRHGEESEKAPEYQVTREDVLAFPEVIREREPTVSTNAEGAQYREWRVERPGPNGEPRQVVYVDKDMGERGRHVVSMYVQEPGRPGFDAQPSQTKTDLLPESPGKWSDTHTGDTTTGLLHQQGQEQSVNPNITQNSIVEKVMDTVSRLLGREEPAQPSAENAAVKADTPEQASAFDLAARNPDALIPTGEFDADGNPVHARASDLVQQAAQVEKQAQTEAAAFDAAVNCALRFPR